MITDWRQRWKKPAIPFYIVELADFLSPDNKGEWNDIHPLNKKTLGERLSLAVSQQKSN